jgi:hypothetical protein
MSLEYQDTPADPQNYLPRCPRCKRLVSLAAHSLADGETMICKDCYNLEAVHRDLWPERALPPLDVCIMCGSAGEPDQ